MGKLPKNCTSRCIVFFLFGFLLINFITLYKSFPTTSSDDYTGQQSTWTHEMELFCFKVQKRIENEKNIKQQSLLFQHNIQITPPNFTYHTRQQSIEISYHYSDWHSSPDLPRRLTPCDHQLYMELLSILDHFFRRHRISYMMMDGTLLGKEKLDFYELFIIVLCTLFENNGNHFRH
jgi:hypothetical protein